MLSKIYARREEEEEEREGWEQIKKPLLAAAYLVLHKTMQESYDPLRSRYFKKNVIPVKFHWLRIEWETSFKKQYIESGYIFRLGCRLDICARFFFLYPNVRWRNSALYYLVRCFNVSVKKTWVY